MKSSINYLLSTNQQHINKLIASNLHLHAVYHTVGTWSQHQWWGWKYTTLHWVIDGALTYYYFKPVVCLMPLSNWKHSLFMVQPNIMLTPLELSQQDIKPLYLHTISVYTAWKCHWDVSVSDSLLHCTFSYFGSLLLWPYSFSFRISSVISCALH